ncbi:hypothetical protein KC345_g30 [Hortaea werneckii]|nr:hypothetical protein KC345_g30 [Hortaea werneckii]
MNESILIIVTQSVHSKSPFHSGKLIVTSSFYGFNNQPRAGAEPSNVVEPATWTLAADESKWDPSPKHPDSTTEIIFVLSRPLKHQQGMAPWSSSTTRALHAMVRWRTFNNAAFASIKQWMAAGMRDWRLGLAIFRPVHADITWKSPPMARLATVIHAGRVTVEWSSGPSPGPQHEPEGPQFLHRARPRPYQGACKIREFNRQGFGRNGSKKICDVGWEDFYFGKSLNAATGRLTSILASQQCTIGAIRELKMREYVPDRI